MNVTFTDYFHKCWKPSCFRTEASDISSSGTICNSHVSDDLSCLIYRLSLNSSPMQVVALCQAPFLLDDPNVGMIFPADAIARAKHYLSLTSGGLGMSFIRELRSCFILA